MALPTTYNTGTATVAANGVAVSGQGTTWLTSGLQAGDLFWAAGLNVRIASIESNTALTLASAWPGATRTALPYEVLFTPEATRLLASTRAVLDILTDGDIAAIAGLASAADKMPYFTGAGTAALADLKAKGREVIASANTTELLTRIGPVFGGAAPTPANAGVGLEDGNLNTISKGGIYSLGGTWTNGPAGSGAATVQGILEVRERTSGFCEQTLYLTSGQIHKRTSFTASTSAWPLPWYRADTTRQDVDNISIADDAVFSKTFNANCYGHGFLSGSATNAGIFALFRFRSQTPSRVDIITSLNGTVAGFAGDTTLTGTTGTDGALTIAAVPAGLQFENRLGGSQSLIITTFRSVQ